MNPSIRLILVALLLVPPGVCQGEDPAPSPDDQSVAAAQGVSNGVGQSLHGVIGNLTAGKVSEIYGEAQRGDPNMVAGGRSGTGATANGGTNLPPLPVGLRREAGAPPAVSPAGPAADAPTGVWGRVKGWFSSTPPTPPAKPVANPSFSRAVPCPDGKPGCVEVMSVKENTAEGLKSLPITDFVEYGTISRKGKADTQVFDKRPWWKFWADRDQVSSDDVRQGGLGDCALLASLAAISSKEPQILRKMIKQQQGTLAVWIEFFEEPAKPVMVGPVDEQFPVFKSSVKAGGADRGGVPVFSGPAGEQGAIWPLLIEKAYAIKFNKGSFAELNEGVWPEDAMTHITGQPSHKLVIEPKDSRFKGPVSFQDLVTWDTNSQPITMSTKSPPQELNKTTNKWETAACPADAPARSTGTLTGIPPTPAIDSTTTAGSTTDSVCTDPLYMGPKACVSGSDDPVCAAPDKIVKLEMTHAYWVKKVDEGSQTVTLANPWGSKQPVVTVPWTRLQKSLYYIYVNDKSP